MDKDKKFQPYLDFLTSLKTDLGELTDLIREKTVAVERNDITKLDHIIHQEQAIYLSLRGSAQNQKKLLQDSELAEVPLSELATYYPEEMQPEVAQTTASLLQLYQKYQKNSQRTQAALDVNLQHIERIYAKQMELGEEPSALAKFSNAHSIDRKA